MEKKNYEKLELEIVSFETDDVIVTSCDPVFSCPVDTPDIGF